MTQGLPQLLGRSGAAWHRKRHDLARIAGRAAWLAAGLWVVPLAAYGLWLLSDDRLAVPLALVRSMALTQPLFSLHTATGALALVLLWLQVSPWLPRTGPAHRWRGRAYAACCLISAAAAVPVALFSPGGPGASAALLVLAGAWLATLWPLVLSARRGDLAAHRRWVWRHAALTSAAPVLRGLLALDLPLGYAATTWLSFLLPLLLAEGARTLVASGGGAYPPPGQCRGRR